MFIRLNNGYLINIFNITTIYIERDSGFVGVRIKTINPDDKIYISCKTQNEAHEVMSKILEILKEKFNVYNTQKEG